MKINISKLLPNSKHELFVLAIILFSGAALAQTTYTLNYTGNVQTLNLQAGSYDVEMWGADGGGTTGTNANAAVVKLGGKGGYAKGTLTLSAASTVSVYVGGKGNTEGIYAPGGFNGGGNSGGGSSGVCGSGGGASDIRVGGNTFADRQIVAGGGGAAGYTECNGAANAISGGHGGGLTGGAPLPFSYANRIGHGGTQTAGGAGGTDATYVTGSPGSFGQGGHGGITTVSSGNGGGGGGGWYGGGSGANGFYCAGGGGGGSSYIGGVSNGTTAMFGTAGFVANPVVTGNGLVIITELCSITLTATGVNASGICTGNSVTLTTNAISNYSWSTGASSSSLIVSPGSTTLYSLTATSPSNCTSSAAVTITVNPIPDLSATASSTLLCASAPVTITASGASTYTWAGGAIANTISVNPSVSTVYSFTGTSAAGCVGTGTANVIVNSLTITVPSSATICEGESVNVTASGAVSYMWSNGSPFSTLVAIPPASTSYTLDASDANNCPHKAIVNVTVNNSPTVTASADKNLICKGEAVTLTAGGSATTYTWNNPSSTNAVITITPAIDVTYYYDVTGTDNNGCKNTATVSVEVDRCSGLSDAGSLAVPLDIFPNPNNGSFTIKSQKNLILEISNELGQIIKRMDISAETGNEVLIKDLPAGVYMVSTSDRTMNYKIVVAK